MKIETDLLKNLLKLGMNSIKLCIEINKHVVKDSVSYPELVEEIQKNIPAGCTYCAITRKNVPAGIEIIGVYLDAEKKVIPNKTGNSSGIWMTTKQIDKEIDEMFQGKDMVLFS